MSAGEPDLIEYLTERLESARETYQGTEPGSFANGQMMGAVHAYRAVLEHVRARHQSSGEARGRLERRGFQGRFTGHLIGPFECQRCGESFLGTQCRSCGWPGEERPAPHDGIQRED